MSEQVPQLSLVRSWCVALNRLARFVLYRWGVLKERPSFQAIHPELVRALTAYFGWRRRFRLIGGEHCPQHGPVLFAGNHLDIYDPAHCVKVVYTASGGNLKPNSMMRNDFFRSAEANRDRRVSFLDEFMESLGGIRISRGSIQLSQVRPLVQVLLDDQAIVMFPNGTRTRSGTFFEYREAIDEPGTASFFILQAQRRKKGITIPAVPLARTLNLVKKTNTYILDEPMCLASDADRAAQRDFDYALVERMAMLVEVNVAQVVSGVLYLRALHHLPPTITTSDLRRMVAQVFATIRHPHVDPSAVAELDADMRQALTFLYRRGMVRLRGPEVIVEPEHLLSSPPQDRHYKKKNPAKYLINQILHLSDVTSAIEAAVLGPAAATAPESAPRRSR